MNASDVIKAKQSKVLFDAYYRPTIFSSINSTINYCPISTISTSESDYLSSITSSITINYLYRCTPTSPSYELANSINNGKYIVGFPYCSTITDLNTGKTDITGVCDCKISFLTWKDNTPTQFLTYKYNSPTDIEIASTSILTGPSPIICSPIEFYQGNICNKPKKRK